MTPARFRFAAGTMRFGSDRHTPVIGDLRSKENTRRIERPIFQASTPIANMTPSNSLFVSVNYVVHTLST